MTRIFLSLASLSIMLLAGALMLGLSMGDLYARPEPTLETLHWATFHRLSGIAAALAVVFVESVVITYFIGTSRWCKEVVETFQLDPSAVVESNRLKRRTFPMALLGMLAVIGIICLGGASDPGLRLRLDAKDWANWHLVGAFLGILFIAWTYLVSWGNIMANQSVIERLVADVARIREARAAKLNAEAGLTQQ